MIYDFLMFNRSFAYTALSLIGLLALANRVAARTAAEHDDAAAPAGR
jgi:hypothetical protein